MKFESELLMQSVLIILGFYFPKNLTREESDHLGELTRNRLLIFVQEWFLRVWF